MGKLLIISGDDEFSVKAKARELAAELCGGDPENDPALEIVAGGGEAMAFAEAVARTLSALRTPPFLSDHQIIWLRNFAFFPQLCDAYRDKGAAAELAEMLVSPLPEEQTVLINGPGLDQRKSWVKALKGAGAEMTFFQRGRSSDRNFAEGRRLKIGELCRDAGKSIRPEAVRYIEELIGSDPETVQREVEKLLCYIGDAPEITLEDCQAICSRTPEAMGWDFTGALTARDTRRALELLDILLRQGEAEIAVLGMVSKEFQGMVKLRLARKELGLERVHPRTFDQIPESVREAHPENPLLKLHPYRAFKMCEAAERFSDAALREALAAILAANRRLVSGGDPRMVMEQLIFRIAAAR